MPTELRPTFLFIDSARTRGSALASAILEYLAHLRSQEPPSAHSSANQEHLRTHLGGQVQERVQRKGNLQMNV